MGWKNTKKYNSGEKSLKAPFTVYLDLECLIKKEQSCQNNNLEESYTEKKVKYEPSSWAMFTRCSFDEKENKLHYYRGKDNIEKLCKRLKECTMKVFPFLPKRKKVEKVEKLICSIEDKEKYVIHIRALKQALNHGLKLKKVHRVIQFIQKDWLKPYIDMNTELRKKAQNEFEKNFFKLMNNSVFGKTMENVRNHRDIKLVTSDKRRKRLVSEPNYHSHKKFSEHLMAIEMKKTRVKMTKPLYLGMSILDISKILMYELWYDYINPKYGDRAKLCYTDTDSFIIYIKTEDFF